MPESMPWDEMMERLQVLLQHHKKVIAAAKPYPQITDERICWELDAAAIEQAIRLLERVQVEHRSDALAGEDAYLRSLEEMHRD